MLHIRFTYVQRLKIPEKIAYSQKFFTIAFLEFILYFLLPIGILLVFPLFLVKVELGNVKSLGYCKTEWKVQKVREKAGVMFQ